MKINPVGIAAIVSFCLVSNLKLFRATDPNENTDAQLLERRLEGDIPQYAVPYYDYGGKHEVKKKGRRAAAKLQLNNLLQRTDVVQNELLRQGAVQMKLAEQIEQQRFRPPQKSDSTRYHYDSDDSSSSEDEYLYAYPPPSKASYHWILQKKGSTNYELLETIPVIDLTDLDISPYPPVPPPKHGFKGGYAVPEIYKAPSKSRVYVPVKNADAYYKNLGNTYSV